MKELLDHPWHTEGEQHAGFVNPQEGEHGQRKCPTCGDTGSVTACDGGEEPCPDCPTWDAVEA